MLFTYKNRESEKYLKNNTKYKNNIIVAKNVSTINDNPPANRSVYTNNIVSSRNDKSKQLKHPQKNPIKHYRKQLISNNNDSITSRNIDNRFDMPGKNIVTNITDSCVTCNNDNNTKQFKQFIYPNKIDTSKCISYYNKDQYIWKNIGDNNTASRIKRARPLIIQNYNSSMKNYLEIRNKTYDKNNPYINNFPCEC